MVNFQIVRSLLGKQRLALAPRGVPAKRKKIALAVAALVDVVQIVFLPMFVEGALSPFQDALDVVAAVVLVAVLGFRFRLALAFGAELVPGLALFPTWTAVIASVKAAPPPASAPPELAPSPGEGRSPHAGDV